MHQDIVVRKKVSVYLDRIISTLKIVHALKIERSPRNVEGKGREMIRCGRNSTLWIFRYVKSASSQCLDGVEAYLSDAFVQRRESNQPNLFLYGTDARTKRSIVEIHTDGFDGEKMEEDDDEDEIEDLMKNTIWSVDPTYEITAIAFDEPSKQVYMAVEQDQTNVVYRISVGVNRARQTIWRSFDSVLEKSS